MKNNHFAEAVALGAAIGAAVYAAMKENGNALGSSEAAGIASAVARKFYEEHHNEIGVIDGQMSFDDIDAGFSDGNDGDPVVENASEITDTEFFIGLSAIRPSAATMPEPRPLVEDEGDAPEVAPPLDLPEIPGEAIAQPEFEVALPDGIDWGEQVEVEPEEPRVAIPSDAEPFDEVPSEEASEYPEANRELGYAVIDGDGHINIVPISEFDETVEEPGELPDAGEAPTPSDEAVADMDDIVDNPEPEFSGEWDEQEGSEDVPAWEPEEPVVEPLPETDMEPDGEREDDVHVMADDVQEEPCAPEADRVFVPLPDAVEEEPGVVEPYSHPLPVQPTTPTYGDMPAQEEQHGFFATMKRIFGKEEPSAESLYSGEQRLVEPTPPIIPPIGVQPVAEHDAPPASGVAYAGDQMFAEPTSSPEDDEYLVEFEEDGAIADFDSNEIDDVPDADSFYNEPSPYDGGRKPAHAAPEFPSEVSAAKSFTAEFMRIDMPRMEDDGVALDWPPAGNDAPFAGDSETVSFAHVPFDEADGAGSFGAFNWGQPMESDDADSALVWGDLDLGGRETASGAKHARKENDAAVPDSPMLDEGPRPFEMPAAEVDDSNASRSFDVLAAEFQAKLSRNKQQFGNDGRFA